MRIALYSRNFSETNIAYLYSVLQELQQRSRAILVHSHIFQSFPEILHKFNNIEVFSSAEELERDIDFLISLGGDGTMLDAVSLIYGKQIPMLGINFGRLGFLASTGKEDLKASIEALAHHAYTIEQRALLHVEADIPLFNDVPFALNDFTIAKKDISSIIKIKTYLNGEFLNTYWADGLIVSTPTGSTAYNMSCNGPIIFPTSSSFVITPIASHQLNVRPIVVSDNHIISFEIESRSESFICSLDARRAEVASKTRIAIRKAPFAVGIVRLQENSFLSALKNKLGWGNDTRNN